MGGTTEQNNIPWTEVIDKVIADTNIKDKKKFREWMQERECVKAKLFGSEMWVKCYNIWKKVNKEDNDYFAAICGREGSGKSTLGIQMAAVIKPDWKSTHLLYTPDRLPQILREGKKGDVIVLDEGNMFLFSREAMGGGNKLMVKLMALIRQRNLVVLICIPNYFTIDSYLRDHRLHGIFNIPKGRGKFTAYNDKYLKKLSKDGAKYKNIAAVRVPYDGWFKCWNSAVFPANVDQEEYLRLKEEHFDEFIEELDDALQAMSKRKSTDWMDMPEAKSVIPLCDTTIIKLIKDGTLEGKQVARKWVLLKDSVEAYMADTSTAKTEKEIFTDKGLPIIGGIVDQKRFVVEPRV